ncbi:MAG: glycosyltransferase family 2 protein [Pirellulales bacterium]|nr:glycosyltransferase family 2 protein [Pirellulales bacterium]
MPVPAKNEQGLKVSNKGSSGYPSLSIIIVNWNSKDYLRQCLKSIESNGEELATQVIVVDGGSFDGCDEMLSNEFPWVEFFQSKDNIGFGRCNNLGAEKATGEYLLLLNPDTEIESGALQGLLETAEQVSESGIIGAKLLNSDKTLQTSCVQNLPTPINQALDTNLGRRLFPRSSLWGTYKAYHSDSPTPVEAVSGACMLIQRNLFEKIGGFSPQYFMYAEDMDLCFKTRSLGRSNFYCPTSTIVHHGGGSSDQQFSKFSTVFMRESLYMYMRTNLSAWHSFAYRIAMAANAFVRIPFLAILTLFTHFTSNHRPIVALKRWAATLSWTVGLENWARRHSKPIDS